MFWYPRLIKVNLALQVQSKTKDKRLGLSDVLGGKIAKIKWLWHNTKIMPKLKVQILSSKFINFNFDSMYLIALEVQGQTILHCKDLEYTKYEPIGQRCANIPRSCHEVLKSGDILNKQGFGQSPCGILVMTFAYQMERQWFESTARRMLLSQKEDLNMWPGDHYSQQKLWIVNPLCPAQKWGVRI